MEPTDADPGSVTSLLLKWRDGDPAALDALVPLVYDELHRLARLQMRGEHGHHTLQPTALVHEAYTRLIGLELDWQDRSHFMSMAARLMRRVLVDHARARGARKRGAGTVRVSLADTLEDRAVGGSDTGYDLMALDEALAALARRDARPVQVVELHYFGGLGYREIAEAVQISEATVDRDLRFARAWLRRELSGR